MSLQWVEAWYPEYMLWPLTEGSTLLLYTHHPIACHIWECSRPIWCCIFGSAVGLFGAAYLGVQFACLVLHIWECSWLVWCCIFESKSSFVGCCLFGSKVGLFDSAYLGVKFGLVLHILEKSWHNWCCIFRSKVACSVLYILG